MLHPNKQLRLKLKHRLRVLIEHDDIQVDEIKDKHVPLTIICGFLGAGKSTLLKSVMAKRSNMLFRLTAE